MKDATISVRLPSSLIQELKELSEKNHYLDLSEQIREILRIKCNQYLEKSNNENHSSKNYSNHIQFNTSQSSNQQINKTNQKEVIVQKLQDLLNELKKEI